MLHGPCCPMKPDNLQGPAVSPVVLNVLCLQRVWSVSLLQRCWQCKVAAYTGKDSFVQAFVHQTAEVIWSLNHFLDFVISKTSKANFQRCFSGLIFLFCFLKSFRPAVAGKRGKYESFGSSWVWAILLVGTVYPKHFSFSFWISKYFITSLEMQCFEFSPFSRGPLSNLIILSNETWFYVGLFCF